MKFLTLSVLFVLMAVITSAQNKIHKSEGKQLSKEDFTDFLRQHKDFSLLQPQVKLNSNITLPDQKIKILPLDNMPCLATTINSNMPCLTATINSNIPVIKSITGKDYFPILSPRNKINLPIE